MSLAGFEPVEQDNFCLPEIILKFLYFAQAITRIVNTCLNSSGDAGDLEGRHHGSSALDGVGGAPCIFSIGGAQDVDTHLRIFDKRIDDLEQGMVGHGSAQAIEAGLIDELFRLRFFDLGIGLEVNGGDGCLQCFRSERLAEECIVARHFSGRAGAHGQQQRVRGAYTQMGGQLRTAKPGHEQISENAVGVAGLRRAIEDGKRIFATGSLRYIEPSSLKQNSRDGKANGIVIDHEDTARYGIRAGFHVGRLYTEQAILSWGDSWRKRKRGKKALSPARLEARIGKLFYSVGVDEGEQELRLEVEGLKQRVAQLEAALARMQPVAPPAAAPPAASLPWREESLESRIGSRLFNRIGIVAVLVGVAWFLKIAFDNRWMGAAGKVTAGIAAGVALIGWSEWFHRHEYDAFSYSLKAVGAGLLYLSLWAAWGLFHLFSLPLTAAAMVVVTAGIGLLAWARESELLAFYAATGGFLTPLLLSDGHNHEAALFGYLLMLDAAALALAAARPWPRLAMGAFLATAAYGAGWYAVYYTDPQFALTLALAILFLLLFALEPFVARGVEQRSGVLLAVAVLNAIFGFLGTLALFGPDARTWVALALAGFYFALAWARRRAAVHVLIGNGFLLAAVSFGIHSYWLGSRDSDRWVDEQVGYSVWFMAFGALLLATGFWRRVAALRWQGLIVLCLAIGKVFLVDMRTLSAGYRVLSFLGLGALLMAVSFAYQKDWLSLRSSRG